VTLTGNILGVDNIETIIVTAKRLGLSEIIIPKDNRPYWDNIESFIKENLKPHFVSHYREVYSLIF